MVQLGRAERRGRRARAIGAKASCSNPTIARPRLAPDRARDAARSATVRVGVRVRNDGPPARSPPKARSSHGMQTIPVSFPGRRSRTGRRRRRRTTVTVAEPGAVGASAARACTTLTLAVGRESSYSARVGLRQLTWHAGRMYLNGAAPAAARRVDPGGRARPRRRADSRATRTRSCAELQGDRGERGRARSTRSTPALLERLDAAGILVWQGIGPVEGAGNWYSSTPSLLRRSRAAGAHRRARGRAASVDLRLEPRRRDRRQRPRRRRGQLRADTHALAARRTTRRAWSPSTSGETTRRTAPARCIAESTRSPRPITPAGMTSRRTHPRSRTR